MARTNLLKRPTLLIGYGGYGRDALQRLLHQSALRGVLSWKPTKIGGVDTAQRQLEDLALLVLPDPFEEAVPISAQAAAGAPQFLTDLYRQIKEPPEEARAGEAAMARFVRQIADGLMSQTSFDERDPVGLDLIVLARPNAPEAIPHLDILLQETLRTLADAAFFDIAVQGAENLNCILVLDFDDYWRGAGATPEQLARARALRSALRNSMQSWERRRGQRQVAVDRCYLMDGYTAIGYRQPHLRLDELVLFLELLLFEGLRADKQELYQQRSLGEPITATFGIRLLEESAMVLSRNAAATFGQRWLDALLGDQERCPDREARRVEETLAPYRRAAIERLIKDGRLTELFDARAGQMIDVLMAVPGLTDADWPERLREVFDRERRLLEQDLDRAGWGIVSAIKEQHLKGFDDALVQAVEADLHDDRAPVSLTLVRTAVDGLRDELSSGAEEAPTALPGASDPMQRLERLHGRYSEQLDEWLTDQGRALQWFWPLLALLLALGLAPLTVQVIGDIKLPSQAWLATIVEALQSVDEPIYWTLIWLAVLWPCLALLMQPLIMARIQRAQRFFTSAQRGRFHDHIRALTEPLRDSLLDRVRRNIRSSLANDVLKTLSRVSDRLAERGREMDWLRRQLKAFLTQSIQPETPVRKWVRREGSFDALLETNPPIRERLCSQQRDLRRPFAGWSEHFCDAFLDPLRFIDDLSKQYVEAHEHQEERRSGREELPQRREELIAFIEASNPGLACRFVKDEGVTDAQRWCVTAQRWKNVDGMTLELDNRLRIKADDVIPAADPSRVYLVLLQTGVAAANLERQRP
jgi:hypothetical protein